jgi:hypothetical protein
VISRFDLTIQFVPQALTSQGGLELLGRYLRRIDLGARLRQTFASLRSDYGSPRIAVPVRNLIGVSVAVAPRWIQPSRVGGSIFATEM